MLSLLALTLVAAAPAPKPASSSMWKVEVVPKLVDPPEVAEAVALKKSNLTLARMKLVNAVGAALEAKDHRTAAIALVRIGELELDVGPGWEMENPNHPPCELGEEAFTRAYELAAPLKEPRLLGRVTHNLGWFSEQCKEKAPQEAIRWYRLALDQRRIDHDAQGVRASANNLGRMLLFDSPGEANLLFLEALNAATVANDLEGQRKIHANLAKVLWLNREKPAPGMRTPAKAEALAHAKAALEAAAKLRAPTKGVCVSIGLVDCEQAGDAPEGWFPADPAKK